LIGITPQLLVVHDVFHVSQLKKFLRVPEEQVPLEDLVPGEDLVYQEYKNVMRNKTIKTCKVQWSHHTEEDATWEREEDLKAESSDFFVTRPNPF
jgi:hypothetical protein